MTPTILAIRAVTSEYARQLLMPVLFIGVAVYILVMAIIIWIATAASGWWLILAIVPTFVIIIGLILWTIAWSLAIRIMPGMSKKQRAATRKFVGHIGRAAEQLGTPRFILLFRIIKDIVSPASNERTFIGEIAQTPGEMKRDFEELRKLF